MKYYQIISIAIGVIVFFILLWILIAFMISQTSRWSRLATKYKTTYTPPKTEIIKNQRIKMGTARYNSIINIHFSDKGIYLAISKSFNLFHPPSLILNLFHPPLLIPWSNITNVKKTAPGIIFRYVTMNVNEINISLPEQHYDEIMRHLNNH
jgi:hypothetical protein